MTETADTKTNGHSEHEAHDAGLFGDSPMGPLFAYFEEIVANPEKMKEFASTFAEPLMNGAKQMQPFMLRGLAAALEGIAESRAERNRQAPITDAQNSWEIFVNAQFDKSDNDFFVASVALKGVGDIGFGPVRRLPCGLLALGVVGNGPDKKPAKMDRHFSTADIAMMGIVEVLVEAPKSSIVQ